MKPVLLTPEKAASLADAYRQFSEDPTLEGRVSGLTRIECYKLLQEVRVLYQQRDVNLTLAFLDKAADGTVVLSEEIFSQEHDDKLTAEHNGLVDKIEEQRSPGRIVFRSSPAPKPAAEKSPTRTDEIQELMEERNRERIEARLVEQGVGAEQAKVYTEVITTRVKELGPEAVGDIVKEVAPELTPEQGDVIAQAVADKGSEAPSRSEIGTTMDSLKYPTSSARTTATQTTAVPRETMQQTIVRLQTRELPPLQRAWNEALNQVIPGRREKQEAAARTVTQAAVKEFSATHPGQDTVAVGLAKASEHGEVLKRLDPTASAHFYTQGDSPPSVSASENYSTFQFEFNQPTPGSIAVRSLGTGAPPPMPSPQPQQGTDSGGPSLIQTAQTALQGRDAYRFAASETGKKVFQGALRQGGAALGRVGASLATSVLPAIGSGLAAAGGAAMTAAGVVGGVISGLTAGAVATVTAPILITIIAGLFIVLLVFGFTAISGNQRLYVAEGTPSVAVQSEYIDVVATVNPNSYKGSFPKDFEFTIVVTAKKANLTNVKLDEAFSVYASKGNPSPPSIEKHTLPTEMAQGKSETIKYTLSLDSDYDNAIVTNTVTVSADAFEGPKDEKTITSTSTLIGDVPTGCFAFSGNWTDDKRALILQAIGTMARSTAFMGNICRGGTPVTLVRSYESKSYGGMRNGNTVTLYDLGVSDKMSTLYTLAHESGHIVDGRNPDFFRDFPKEIKGEGSIPTYPLTPSPPEDFAETIADYVVWKEMSFCCIKGERYKLNMPTDFSKHYRFANKRIFGGYEY
ncbi:MAG: hypothetical protein Q7S79_01805 [bacterium]|nr:hypothetical protein [bacterium]